MASFSRVPVVDVHSDNIGEVWPSMILAISNAAFVALDTELSGLGNRKKLNAKSIEDRYKSICETARSRSILSLGISCFQQMPASSTASNEDEVQIQPSSYIVQTFNLLMLCEEDFMVEPLSLKFLVQHGFDFNKQFEKGISYYQGQDKEHDKTFKTPRHLFAELISMNVPIILHNGLVDLMFLYENLYTNLPPSSNMFLADLGDMFPAGVIDTKYITEFEHLMPASYLEYVFRKCQKDNVTGSLNCLVHHPHYPHTYAHVTYRDCSIKLPYNITDNPGAYKQAVCESYSGHGWCSKNTFCPKSHDIDLIIDIDCYMEGRKSRKRKRREQNRKERGLMNQSTDNDDTMETDNNDEFEIKGSNSENESVGNDAVNTEDILKKLKSEKSDDGTHTSGCHRAGYDAFMTGFIYAVFRLKHGIEGDKTPVWKNKLYLCGKDYPLSVSKSSFVKQSKQHVDKIARIRKTVV